MYECQFCGSERKSIYSLKSHEVRCKKNPNRIKSYCEDWTEEKRIKHSTIMKEKNTNSLRFFSVEQRLMMSKNSKEANRKYWTADARKRHSEKMKENVRLYPESYSTKNISGRVKMFDAIDSFGKHTKLKGNWELIVSKYLSENNIRWSNDIKPFSYFWNSGWHLYFPDFYLPDLDLYIEVKGYERERDRCKWKEIKNLIVLKNKEISEILIGKYDKKNIAGWTGDGTSLVS